jgi:CRP-like cAMP-binding protein
MEPIPRVALRPAGTVDWPARSFAALASEHDLQLLLHNNRQLGFSSREVVMREGDDGGHVMILLDGQVKVETSDGHGRKHLLGVLGRGDLVGELACLDSAPRSASVIGLGRGVVVSVPHRHFLAALDTSPTLSLQVARLVGTRLRAADRRRVDFSSYATLWLLARELVGLCPLFRSPGQRQAVRIGLTQDELAQMINRSRVSVQRAMRTLRKHGLAKSEYGEVVVPCSRCLQIALPSTNQAGHETAECITGCRGERAHG